ncbi:hypothetical protein [Saccharopolyspora gregorii]|uniref:hypothetical protein n=1 Tax=Saccharopolyspora gregorii TaxID=33914 RepID=UPI0031E93444
MHTYKTPAATQAGTKRLELLARLGVGLHARCIQQATGKPISGWAVVPSTRSPGAHPLLHAVVLPAIRTMAPPGEPHAEISLGPGAEFRRTPRELVPGMWKINPGANPAEHHVLLIDDTWTTGGNAQSAAVALRSAGASAVTILTLARWLDRSRELVPEFIMGRLAHRNLDLFHCPALTSGCPQPREASR